MPAEPRLRHCSLNRSIGSWEPLEPSIFLHFCLICASDLAVAAMFQSLLWVTNMAPFASHEGFIIPLLWQRPHRVQSLHGKKKQWAQKLFKQKKTQTKQKKFKKREKKQKQHKTKKGDVRKHCFKKLIKGSKNFQYLAQDIILIACTNFLSTLKEMWL